MKEPLEHLHCRQLAQKAGRLEHSGHVSKIGTRELYHIEKSGDSILEQQIQKREISVLVINFVENFFTCCSCSQKDKEWGR